jgi:hypothetical protein
MFKFANRRRVTLGPDYLNLDAWVYKGRSQEKTHLVRLEFFLLRSPLERTRSALTCRDMRVKGDLAIRSVPSNPGESVTYALDSNFVETPFFETKSRIKDSLGCNVLMSLRCLSEISVLIALQLNDLLSALSRKIDWCLAIVPVNGNTPHPLGRIPDTQFQATRRTKFSVPLQVLNRTTNYLATSFPRREALSTN